MKSPFHLFEVFGIELEYMIVDRRSLRVAPIADKLIKKACGSFEEEIERGATCWSNELALHVIELKTNGPAADLASLGAIFHQQVGAANGMLEEWNACLMPSAMHPFMVPERDMKLWPHGRSEVYEAFNRIFNCKGHGWSNLQSMHINLPFANDTEFGSLHAAIRVLLPILPALAASSPIQEGKLTGSCDTRLKVYQTNQAKVPSIAGDVIPEPVWSEKQYHDEIFSKIYKDIEPLDPDKVLQHEWLNSRGAIARFDRSAIEIRVVDVQESPSVDIAFATAIVAALRGLVEGSTKEIEDQKNWRSKDLKKIFDSAITSGSQTKLDETYTKLFGLTKACTARDLWNHILEQSLAKYFPSIPVKSTQALTTYLKHGTLAERMIKSTPHGSLEEMSDVGRQICRCLMNDQIFMTIQG